MQEKQARRSANSYSGESYSVIFLPMSMLRHEHILQLPVKGLLSLESRTLVIFVYVVFNEHVEDELIDPVAHNEDLFIMFLSVYI